MGKSPFPLLFKGKGWGWGFLLVNFLHFDDHSLRQIANSINPLLTVLFFVVFFLRARRDKTFPALLFFGHAFLSLLLSFVLGRVNDTDHKIAAIESRRKMVEEVQTRANAITNLLDDINVNLEMLGEQRAVIDHVGEKIARLDFMVQEAQNTLRALQREREVAERIEQGIKSLRASSGGGKIASA